MREDIFDFDVIARGHFIDSATGGDPFMIEAITIRLNHIAFNQYQDYTCFGPEEAFRTDAEWEQHKAEKEQGLVVWKKTIVDKLELFIEKRRTSVTITQAKAEVFTVIYTERLEPVPCR